MVQDLSYPIFVRGTSRPAIKNLALRSLIQAFDAERSDDEKKLVETMR
jgi:hypothetical protein